MAGPTGGVLLLESKDSSVRMWNEGMGKSFCVTEYLVIWLHDQAILHVLVQRTRRIACEGAVVGGRKVLARERGVFRRRGVKRTALSS